MQFDINCLKFAGILFLCSSSIGILSNLAQKYVTENKSASDRWLKLNRWLDYLQNIGMGGSVLSIVILFSIGH